MKRTDRVTNAVVAVLFAAMLCYIGFYVIESVGNRVQTAVAVNATAYESIIISGIIVRNEHYITSEREYINVTAQEAKRVSKGQTVAVSYSSEAGLERATRIRELELEIGQLRVLLGNQPAAQDVTNRENAVREAVRSLALSVARQDNRNIDEDLVRLSSLILDSDGSDISYVRLSELESELYDLRTVGTADTFSITAPEAGMFSSLLDGYEHISFVNVSSSGADYLHTLMNDRRDTPHSAIGKLVTSSVWYYAVLVSEAEAKLLEPGSTVNLIFGKYFRDPLTATVISVSGAKDGECAAVFSCDKLLAETLPIRHISAEAVFREITGIRVPKEAVHRDGVDDGSPINWQSISADDTPDTYVLALTGPMLEKKTVRVIYESGDYYLVEISGSSDALREGNEIAVSGNDLYPGKLIR